MIKKIIQISSAIAIVLLLVSCKNTKQKLQEYVITYNTSIAPSFKGENITGTTARGYLEDNKIEIRIETDLEQNESNKQKYSNAFPVLLAEMIKKDQLPKELIEEGVSFHTYFLAKDNTVLSKVIINKEELKELLKEK
ncbi:hypothetical protein [Flavobacterium hydatis]|uniref:Lipoprotein n=1 Tax=Flavobacterium hydatis TaxID=991 RepID=A0A086AFS9_FLAHY|nr:hypothetical protein [Flavobacterium hydatis]KFF15543.1 hypothetical protein IW20_13740 [Flavobacterium hydatis]OXA89873.1 hypothetical protein B0A62_20225 [Flavobacterium hydatis]